MIKPTSRKGMLIMAALAAAIATSLWWWLHTPAESLPKPYGYFRIELPEKSYTRYKSPCDIAFDLPNFSKIELYKGHDTGDSCWFNVSYPRLRAKVYCTVLPVQNDLSGLIKDAYGFAAKHEMKATALQRTTIEVPYHRVYGIMYDLEGMVASQLQFFVTDSTSHFMRGALYFDHKPNPDSIAPVLEYIREDVKHLLQTLEWTTE